MISLKDMNKMMIQDDRGGFCLGRFRVYEEGGSWFCSEINPKTGKEGLLTLMFEERVFTSYALPTLDVALQVLYNYIYKRNVDLSELMLPASLGENRFLLVRSNAIRGELNSYLFQRANMGLLIMCPINILGVRYYICLKNKNNNIKRLSTMRKYDFIKNQRKREDGYAYQNSSPFKKAVSIRDVLKNVSKLQGYTLDGDIVKEMIIKL